MIFDIKTLLAGDTLLTAFIALALLFFRRRQQTYPGFDLWVAGSCVAAMAYTAMCLRGTLPVGLSVVLTNLATGSTVVLRLDGVMRFMKGRALAKGWYSVPLGLTLFNAAFYWGTDSLAVRTAALSLTIVAGTCVMSYYMIRHAPAGQRGVYVAAGGLHLFLAAATLLRAVVLAQTPANTNMFAPDVANGMFYLAILVYETGWALAFFLMNGQRLAAELRQKEEELRASVSKLEHALSEVRTLQEFLPICASCHQIRDDQGYWSQLEAYLVKHTDVQFSHGLCPACIRRLYPDIADSVIREMGAEGKDAPASDDNLQFIIAPNSSSGAVTRLPPPPLMDAPRLVDDGKGRVAEGRGTKQNAG